MTVDKLYIALIVSVAGLALTHGSHGSKAVPEDEILVLSVMRIMPDDSNAACGTSIRPPFKQETSIHGGLPQVDYMRPEPARAALMPVGAVRPFAGDIQAASRDTVEPCCSMNCPSKP